MAATANAVAQSLQRAARTRWFDGIRAKCLGYSIDRKSTRLNSSHDQISYAVFCLKKKKKNKRTLKATNDTTQHTHLRSPLLIEPKERLPTAHTVRLYATKQTTYCTNGE